MTLESLEVESSCPPNRHSPSFLQLSQLISPLALPLTLNSSLNMEEKTSVILHDRQLVGANGGEQPSTPLLLPPPRLPPSFSDSSSLFALPGLTVFYQLRSYTLSIDLSHNDLFGPDGLKVLLEGLVDLNDVNGKGKGSESKLRSLKLTDCGLGFIDGDGE